MNWTGAGNVLSLTENSSGATPTIIISGPSPGHGGTLGSVSYSLINLTNPAHGSLWVNAENGVVYAKPGPALARKDSAAADFAAKAAEDYSVVMSSVTSAKRVGSTK